MQQDSFTALGAFLTTTEARRLADALQAGDSTAQALREVHTSRRAQVRDLLAGADLGRHHLETSIAVLSAIAGACSVRTAITPVWTMPGPVATTGRLTSRVQQIIDQARMSVVCSSYNFSASSRMWTALREASQRPGVSVTVYLDATHGSPTTVAAHLPKATIYRTTTPMGGDRPYVSHAKFIIVDRTVTLLTSANFSHSAENANVELGLLVEDGALAASIEEQMRAQHGVLYERELRSAQ